MKTLEQIYYDNRLVMGNSGGDKGTNHSFIQHYQEWFEPYRNSQINFLEIGVDDGNSIKMWREYFTRANIYGADLRDRTKLPIDNVKIFCGDSTQKSFWDAIDIKFNIVIEDGSHLLEHQIETFRCMKDKVESGGIYIIEDVLPHIESAFERFNQEFPNDFKMFDFRNERPNQGDNVLFVHINEK